MLLLAFDRQNTDKDKAWEQELRLGGQQKTFEEKGEWGGFRLKNTTAAISTRELQVTSLRGATATGADVGIVCLFVCCLTSQQHASVSQGRICSDNLGAATLRQKLQIKLSISPSHSILTSGLPVPALTL